ncbi:MAG: hypothetical protein Kow0031_16650 [Anaerolineae bacterium]
MPTLMYATKAQKLRVLVWGLALLALLLLTAIALSLTNLRQSGPLLISELMAANSAGLTDEDGDFSDWIEIHNPTGQAINMSGYALTDDPANPAKWTFPDVSLPAGGYLLVFASGKNRLDPAGPLHTNFRLRQEGDFLGLYSVLNQRFADALEPRFPPQFQDMAYGRIEPGGEFGFLAEATPGQPNSSQLAWLGQVEPVQFSVGRGYFSAPFEVALTTATPGATIRYTTDGSEPTAGYGLTYSNPIAINGSTPLRAIALKEGLLPSASVTHSYIFVEDVLSQPANPPGFPTTWGTHQVDFEDFVAGTPVEPDYAMDPEITTDPRYRQQLIDGLTDIPALSLTMDMAHFDDLYSNPQGRDMLWERPVSIEWLPAGGIGPQFQTNAGIRIQGGVGRNEFYPKHSFRLFFRSQYGPATLNFPVFPDSPVTEFDTLVLRGGVNRSFVGTFQNRQTTYTRDEWSRASQVAVSGVSPHGAFVHLYLNGLYWGLYNLTERPDAGFAAAHLGGQPEDWVVMNHGGTVDGPDPELGALIEQYRTLAEAEVNPALRDALRASLPTLVDITQFFDYVIVNWYAGNQDWGENNWYAARRLPDGPLNYFVWDAEKTWFEGADIYLGKPDASRPNVVRPILTLLLENPDYRLHLADRLYRHLFNNGALTDANALARWRDITEPLERPIVAESARWGDFRDTEEPITQTDWLAARDNVAGQMEGNAARLIDLARAQGFYPPLDPPQFSQHGGRVGDDFTLAMTLPELSAGSRLYFTTDGSDPRQPGSGAAAGSATLYSGPVAITQTTTVKARALSGSDWSALAEAEFYAAPRTSQVRLTEIMYNPPDGSDYEFIELKNVGNGPLDLSNATFSGINFTFPGSGAVLRPGEFFVLVRNPAAFTDRYPDVAVTGEFSGNLSNNGETISLFGPDGKLLETVTYNDKGGWPISPDGRGDSLVLTDDGGDPNSPRSWRASRQVGGSPGSDE